MGKLWSGFRTWSAATTQLLRIAVESLFARLVAGSHSFMNAEPLSEGQLEVLLGLLGGGLLASATAVQGGVLPQFLVGFVVGGALMAAWEKLMERRCRERSTIAGIVALLGGTSLKVIAGYERVEWLNRLLKAAWPYVGSATEFARPSIRDCLEPLLEECRLGLYQVIRERPEVQLVEKYIPTEEIITSLHINAVSLGTTPPTIEGLKIHRLKEGKIVCSVRMAWQSDSRITLGVGTVAGIVSIMLENLKIVTTARVILRMTESSTSVAALVVTIPAERKPVVDFSLSVVDSSTTVLPVVTEHLRSLVTSFIINTILWPHRVVLPIVKSSKNQALDLDELHPKLHGQLSVAVIKGENLVNLYPYVTFYCRPEFKVRTRSIENTHDPTWNEAFILHTDDQENQSVTFQVMNENKGPDELLGAVAYRLKDLPLDRDVELQLNVNQQNKFDYGGEAREKKTFGSLAVELRYHVYTDTECEEARNDEEELLKALATPDEPGSYAAATNLIHPY